MLIDDIVEEALTYKLEWENRTTKNGFPRPFRLFEKSSKNVEQLKHIVRKAVDEYYCEV